MSWFWLSLALAAPPEQPLTGTWVPEASATLQSELDASLERAVGAMTWAFRPFARPLLRKQMTVCPKLETRLHAARFRAKCQGGSIDLDRPLDNSEPGFVGEDGEFYEVDLSLAEETVTAAFISEDTLYTVYYQHQGGRLLLRTRIESSRLPEPLDWTVPYRRAE